LNEEVQTGSAFVAICSLRISFGDS
jgi:hypothetical protein